MVGPEVLLANGERTFEQRERLGRQALFVVDRREFGQAQTRRKGGSRHPHAHGWRRPEIVRAARWRSRQDWHRLRARTESAVATYSCHGRIALRRCSRPAGNAAGRPHTLPGPARRLQGVEVFRRHVMACTEVALGDGKGPFLQGQGRLSPRGRPALPQDIGATEPRGVVGAQRALGDSTARSEAFLDSRVDPQTRVAGRLDSGSCICWMIASAASCIAAARRSGSPPGRSRPCAAAPTRCPLSVRAMATAVSVSAFSSGGGSGRRPSRHRRNGAAAVRAPPR